MPTPPATLYVVATPIGNLGDLAPRAEQVLRAVAVIACEDTRVTAKLLAHCGIEGQKLTSYYDQVEEVRAKQLVEGTLLAGHDVALVSDAGTPNISDPGFHLVKLCHERGIAVSPVGGGCALTAAVSASGLPANTLWFGGFLAGKASQRRSQLEAWAERKDTIAHYLPARDIADALGQVASLYPGLTVCVAREITKRHEDIKTAPVETLLSYYRETEHVLKGEAVLVTSLAGLTVAKEDPEQVRARLVSKAMAGFKEGKRQKQLLKELSGEGVPRGELYDLLTAAKTQLAQEQSKEQHKDHNEGSDDDN